jgi:hypothetical protein
MQDLNGEAHRTGHQDWKAQYASGFEREPEHHRLTFRCAVGVQVRLNSVSMGHRVDMDSGKHGVTG